MLVFGVDVPLAELLLVLIIITFILFAEAVVIIALLIRQMNKSHKLGTLIEKLSETLLAMKNKEIEGLDKIRRK